MHLLQKVHIMKYKVGFIGCGNMASAIIAGLINKANISPTDIIASDASEEALELAFGKVVLFACQSDNQSFL